VDSHFNQTVWLVAPTASSRNGVLNGLAKTMNTADGRTRSGRRCHTGWMEAAQQIGAENLAADNIGKQHRAGQNVIVAHRRAVGVRMEWVSSLSVNGLTGVVSRRPVGALVKRWMGCRLRATVEGCLRSGRRSTRKAAVHWTADKPWQNSWKPRPPPPPVSPRNRHPLRISSGR